jgi:hypothetical protein
LKGFIPALVNINVGSSFITNGAEGTMAWPLEAKNAKNVVRISEEVMNAYF